MIDLIPVATVSHKGTNVVVKHSTTKIHSSKKNCVFAKYILGNWIVFTREAEVISGELEEVIIGYCNDNFPYEALLTNRDKKSFLLEGLDNE